MNIYKQKGLIIALIAILIIGGVLITIFLLKDDGCSSKKKLIRQRITEIDSISRIEKEKLKILVDSTKMKFRFLVINDVFQSDTSYQILSNSFFGKMRHFIEGIYVTGLQVTGNIMSDTVDHASPEVEKYISKYYDPYIKDTINSYLYNIDSVYQQLIFIGFFEKEQEITKHFNNQISMLQHQIYHKEQNNSINKIDGQLDSNISFQISNLMFSSSSLGIDFAKAPNHFKALSEYFYNKLIKKSREKATEATVKAAFVSGIDGALPLADIIALIFFAFELRSLNSEMYSMITEINSQLHISIRESVIPNGKQIIIDNFNKKLDDFLRDRINNIELETEKMKNKLLSNIDC